jgi:hypothetical protein
VDWSWSEHAVCIIDDAGAAIERVTVTHTVPGLARLVTLVHRHQVSGVAIERGDGPVAAALLDAGLTVFVIAARQVTALRTRYSTARAHHAAAHAARNPTADTTEPNAMAT